MTEQQWEDFEERTLNLAAKRVDESGRAGRAYGCPRDTQSPPDVFHTAIPLARGAIRVVDLSAREPSPMR